MGSEMCIRDRDYTVINTKQEKKEMIEDQEKLLDVIEKLYPFIADEDVNFSEYCWRIIMLILHRN